jgi:hypothetical protein
MSLSSVLSDQSISLDGTLAISLHDASFNKSDFNCTPVGGLKLGVRVAK